MLVQKKVLTLAAVQELEREHQANETEDAATRRLPVEVPGEVRALALAQAPERRAG